MPHATRDQTHTSQPSVAVAPPRLIRLPEVIARVGLRRSAIYQRMSEGRFPKSRSLGPKCTVWVEAEIDEWVRQVSRIPD
ncbi:AlpA family transcriptional regulator [Novosphingobium sp.]|uniref:AlpA family transcriptional regulator n=1 Tax=Novosphingobium sp. TaxID=1874826 RepID=UPI00262DFA3B|nr:AlpA family transcriptional regulator [Novosphingobium sp.]